MPKEVAEELVKWLEGLLKRAVEKVVKRERKESSGSADSKGQSPEPEGSGREELPDIELRRRVIQLLEGVHGGIGRLRWWQRQRLRRRPSGRQRSSKSVTG